MSRRILVIQLFFCLWIVLIIGRLGYWQIVQADQLQIQAYAEHTSSLVISAPRGQILAGDGFPLVTNQDNYLFYVNPKELVSHPDLQPLIDIVDTLPGSDSARRVLSAVPSSSLSWLAVSRVVSLAVKTQIDRLKLPGLGFELQPIRAYPEGTPSAYLTGFVGKDSADRPLGYFGLEGYYDRQLSGIDGQLIEEKDAFGLPIVIGNQIRIPSSSGRTLVTSIDRTIEYIAFQKLSDGLAKFQAGSGTVTIMDSLTGHILAMVSLPGYDPADFSKYDPALYKNPIISDSYEPGSTFKTIIMASALDAGVVDPVTTRCPICDRPVTVDNYTILSGDGHYYPQSNLFDIIKHSDNIGMVFVSRQLGNRRLLDYIKRFGFGQPTGIDLQEESSPSLRPDREWHAIDYATLSFGQGIAVTPLQMVTAVNALATGGNLISPGIVTQIVSSKSAQRQPPAHSVRVVSLAAAAKVTEMMVNGVKTGAVSPFRPRGYMVAGKTGTAQVPIEGHYDKDKTIASFIGFAPADRPKFTMLVTIREPKSSPWGSTTAAPVWFDIARELFRYFHIPPQPGL